MNLEKSFYVTVWLAQLSIAKDAGDIPSYVKKRQACLLVSLIFSRWPKWFQDVSIAELKQND